MGTIVVNTNITLDGVVDNPTGEEGEGQAWFTFTSEADREAWAKLEYEESLQTDALLLGRDTDAWFATRWNTRTGSWADRLNSLPKYVVSSTLTEAAWANGRVLTGDVVQSVARLKQSIDGRIVIFGSRRLVRTLLEHGLVDELRLIVFGSVVGSGQRLLDIEVPQSLRLTRVEPVGESLFFVTYDIVQAGH